MDLAAKKEEGKQRGKNFHGMEFFSLVPFAFVFLLWMLVEHLNSSQEAFNLIK
jgi:hypothetical protein